MTGQSHYRWQSRPSTALRVVEGICDAGEKVPATRQDHGPAAAIRQFTGLTRRQKSLKTTLSKKACALTILPSRICQNQA